MIKIINTIKCPRCNSTNRTPITKNFFKCNQCGNSYYDNINGQEDGFVQSVNSNSKNNLLLIVISVLVILGLVLYIGTHLFGKNGIDEAESISMIQDQSSNIAQLKSISSSDPAYARTAFVLYKDQNKQSSYLFRADFLTENNDSNDDQAVLIKSEQGELVAYDVLSDKVIPNFNQLISTPLSLDAAVLYADLDNVIIKNKINNDYQLEMLDAYDGEVIWTLSNKELAGIDRLTEKYSSEQNKGIELVDDDFIVKLPPNYFMINRKGDIIDFGKLN